MDYVPRKGVEIVDEEEAACSGSWWSERGLLGTPAARFGRSDAGWRL
jgi:hypothetical protein